MKRLRLDEISVFIVSFVLRVGAITVPLNSDEAKWLSRGAIFLKSLLSGDLTGTYGSSHPGVPNMWLTGIGMVINCRLHQAWPQLLAANQPSELGACTDTLPFAASLYILPRLLQAIVTSACMVGIYWATQQLLGRAIATRAIALLILDPFFLAYQRFVTTDALQSDFSVLALLLLLLYWQGDPKHDILPNPRQHRRLLIISGLCLGLAATAKIIALFIVPGLVLWLALTELGLTRFPRRGWRSQLMDLGCWGGTALATGVAIWPVLWVQPSYTVIRLVNGLQDEATQGDFFFLGASTDAPGWLFYPVVLALRLSPLVQLGLLVWVATVGLSLGRRLLGLKRPTAAVGRMAEMPYSASTLLALGLSALCMVLILSSAQTKIDRYVIFVVPILAILAAAGWVAGSTALQRRWQRRAGSDASVRQPYLKHHLERDLNRGAIAPITSILLTIVIMGQLLLLAGEFPYYIAYYNPLLGGTATAQQALALGQGEGLDRAAEWLNQRPNADQLTVGSWYRSVLAAYFQGYVVQVPKYQEPDDEFWLRANYVVFYVNQWQRSLPDPSIIRYFDVQRPQHAVAIHGVDYVRIYPGPVPTANELEQMDVSVGQVFDDQVRLLGYDINPHHDGTVAIALYWEFLRRPTANAQVQITVQITVGDRHRQTIEYRAPPLGDNLPLRKIPPNTILRDVHWLSLPAAETSTADGATYEHLNPDQIDIAWVARPQKSQEMSKN